MPIIVMADDGTGTDRGVPPPVKIREMGGEGSVRGVEVEVRELKEHGATGLVIHGIDGVLIGVLIGCCIPVPPVGPYASRGMTNDKPTPAPNPVMLGWWLLLMLPLASVAAGLALVLALALAPMAALAAFVGPTAIPPTPLSLLLLFSFARLPGLSCFALLVLLVRHCQNDLDWAEEEEEEEEDDEDDAGVLDGALFLFLFNSPIAMVPTPSSSSPSSSPLSLSLPRFDDDATRPIIETPLLPTPPPTPPTPPPTPETG